MAEAEWSFINTLQVLFGKGLRYSTVIDMGCADGHFFIENYLNGIFPDSVPLHLDANKVYEPSLKSIEEIFGGAYRIAAVSDEPGELAMTTSVHPYWNSLRPSSDLYWERVNKLSTGVDYVPAIRVDDLVEELGLKPPYLVKLDVQGAEVQALRGAKKVLSQASVVICEADVADFQPINAEITASDFELFDVTTIARARDESLAWFYPVYLHKSLAQVRLRHFWGEAENDGLVKMQNARRNTILARLGEVLPSIRASKKPKT
jgi:FkbM family methyltransferase